MFARGAWVITAALDSWAALDDDARLAWLLVARARHVDPTRWPPGFDPRARGAIEVDAPAHG
jgi:hypothetical protein